VAPEIFETALNGFFVQDRKELKKQVKAAEKFNKRVKKQKDEFYKVISKLKHDSIETGHYYVQVLDYQREIGHCLTYLTQPLFEHVENNHKGFIKVQVEEFSEVSAKLKDFFSKMANVVKNQGFDEVDGLIEFQAELLKLVEKHRKKQVKRIKSKEVGTRNSMLYLNLMVEVRNLLLYSINMVKAHRDFVVMSVQ
jgi:Na+/phosphate symporter